LIDKILMNSHDYFNLGNIEHKMIVNSLKEELEKPFIFKSKYYQDEEAKMIQGYVSKTRLANLM